MAGIERNAEERIADAVVDGFPECPPVTPMPIVSYQSTTAEK